MIGYSLVVFLFTFFFACHSNDKRNSISLKPIGNFTVSPYNQGFEFTSAYANILPLNLNQKNYFIRFDFRKQNAGFVSIDSTKNKEHQLYGLTKLFIQQEFIGCSILNWDSIFLITLGQPQQLQLVDSSGKLKNYWYLNGNFEKEYHDFIALPDYSSIIFEPTENCVTLYYHNPSVNERYNYSLNDYWIDNHFYRFKLCSNHSINLINSYGTIPENLHNTFVANFDKISFTGFKGKTLFSYSQNPNVEIFKNDKLIKSEQMTTGSFQPFNKSFDLNKDGNIDYMEDYLHSGDYCYRVFADSKNNYAIRITSIHQPRFLENGTMNRGVNPPWSISFLDSSLHYCGSVIFPKDSVDLTNVFMSNKNIIVIKSIKHENLFYKYQIVCNK